MFAQVIDAIAKRGEEFNPITEADYDVDGILYCGNCHTPKQKKLEFLGRERIVPLACKCASERYAEEERREQEKERMKRAEKLRRDCFISPEHFSWTFANDDGKDERMSKAARAYVENFKQLAAKGKGLLFYGHTGRGKSYMAGCIANALMENGTSCLMTNFAKIEKSLAGRFDKQEQLDSLLRYKLLCLDDFGAERDTTYMQEIVFTIIDARYQAKMPMVITTNLTLDELKKPKNITEERIFKRVLERCFPIEAAGPDRRVLNIIDGYDDTKSLLGL